MSDLREKRVELILGQLEELPTLPAVALRVLQVTSNESSETSEVVHLIESDPSLSTRILQLVRRADSGVRGEVTTVDRAVVLLGFEAVRSAVLAISVFEAFQSKEPASQGAFRREAFWKHCIAVAAAAELIAEASKDSTINPSEAFVCGLLHDLGKVALDATLPKSFSRAVETAELLRGNIADIERQVIGLDHMVVGKRLAEQWNLPTTLRESIWLHNQNPAALPAGVQNAKLVNIVTLADLVVREQHLGYSGNYMFLVSRQTLCDTIGLTREGLDRVLLKLVEHIEPRAVALGLGQANAGELYRAALAQANNELGRVSGQLAAKSRKLSTRAKFFDALSEFQGELRPDAPPQNVLRAIGQTAVGVLGVKSVATFSLLPGRSYAETVLVDHAGEVFETSLVECAPAQSKQSSNQIAPISACNFASLPGDGPVRAAGPELEWFLQAISPRLSDDNRFWICLEADGRCIGGIVWGAPAGESQRLSQQTQELLALTGGWSLALRITQIREESRALAEQLAETHRQLQSAQDQIARSQMMVTVGELAAGAAHEMNNPLAVISGRSQLLSSVLEDPKQKIAARLIFEQSQRLSDIITELMSFAKPSPPKHRIIDPAEIVNKGLHEAKTLVEPADRLIEVTFGDVPVVNVDADQVTEAVKEVISNSIQATDEKSGQIDIHAAFDAVSNRVVITVSDNGSGMDEPTLKRAFDPFFSAKPAGRRRGMGLAKALRWVEASGGSIRLESQLGQGTRTIILLPVAKTDAGTEQLEKRKHA